MITFLNDKCDKNLRGSFFDSVVEVAAYVGWHCSVILAPLLHQVYKNLFYLFSGLNAIFF